MKLKGPVFASYLNQRSPTERAALGRPPRMAWKRHCGSREALRNLRHACAKVLGSNDPADVKAVARVREAVKNEPLPEFGLLHLVSAALDACDQTGEAWRTCMNYLMDQFDAAEEDRKGQATP